MGGRFICRTCDDSVILGCCFHWEEAARFIGSKLRPTDPDVVFCIGRRPSYSSDRVQDQSIPDVVFIGEENNKPMGRAYRNGRTKFVHVYCPKDIKWEVDKIEQETRKISFHILV
ncbi:hypothetical protein HAX54_000826 [Datura stramonium]|uniref:Uncharacterized protein n=1 Tax=Datura stramonium TaxID=4076 RepID=A0ABS8WUV9_DATST|nr:hypothetical protein [Datura stramonium]